MRQVERMIIRQSTGEITHVTEILPDTDFAGRVAYAKSTVPDDVPGTGMLAAVCDGCGAAVAVDYRDPELPDGWTTSTLGEFCPDCHAG